MSWQRVLCARCGRVHVGSRTSMTTEARGTVQRAVWRIEMQDASHAECARETRSAGGLTIDNTVTSARSNERFVAVAQWSGKSRGDIAIVEARALDIVLSPQPGILDAYYAATSR